MTRTAVVIGGASGIGWATAQTLAAEGAEVIIADRIADGAETRAAELGAPHFATAVDVLCSPKSSWITGEVLDLNGGAHLKRYPNVYEHIMKFAGQH